MRISLIIICVERQSVMNTKAQPSTARPEVPRGAAAEPHTLDSATLLGAKREVRIVHEGETYRLCRTRQDKLILIK